MQLGQTLAGQATGREEQVLLGEQTAGSLMRHTGRLYARNIVPITVAYFLPLCPFMIASRLLEKSAPLLSLAMLLCYLVALFFASGALTVLLADICLGNRPTVRRAYGRVLREGLWRKLLGTGLLATLGLYLGLLLLVLPGLWFAMRAVFASTVVTLERRSGRAAIKRSFELTHHQFWRITGLILLMFAVPYCVLLEAASLTGGVVGYFHGDVDADMERIFEMIGQVVALAVVMPMLSLTTVLLYYDQRARREAYDTRALSEDLMR